MTVQQQPPKFDPSRIAFPTDRITLGQMRKREPAFFTSDMVGRKMPDAFSTHYHELELAERAFAKVLGATHPSYSPRELTVSLLASAYKEYGLSSGMQQTRQLIRDFEAAAAQQAREALGRGR